MSNSLADLPPLGERDLDVLQAIVEERPRLVHVAELEGRAGCRETVCKSLRTLEAAHLVRRPRRRNGGVAAEALGVEVIKRFRAWALSRAG